MGWVLTQLTLFLTNDTRHFCFSNGCLFMCSLCKGESEESQITFASGISQVFGITSLTFLVNHTRYPTSTPTASDLYNINRSAHKERLACDMQIYQIIKCKRHQKKLQTSWSRAGFDRYAVQLVLTAFSLMINQVWMLKLNLIQTQMTWRLKKTHCWSKYVACLTL